MNFDYEKHLLDEKCDIFGGLFRWSAVNGLDSLLFIREVMTNPKLENLVYYDEVTEWCDEWFLLGALDRLVPFKKGKVIDDFALWFMGYTYKYWMRTRKTKPKDVYKILPVELFLERFGFYHTQDWEYIVQNALKSYEEHL